MEYNCIKSMACFKYFACVAWRDSLTDSDKLLVASMSLPIEGIKDISEVMLRALVKGWKRKFVRSLSDTIDSKLVSRRGW